MRSILSVLGIAIFITTISITSWAFDSQVFKDGADRLVDLQNTDGGWDWPLDNGDPATGSAQNTISPIGKGLAMAYLSTIDEDHGDALVKVGNFLLAKTTTFSSVDGYLAAQLDSIFGVSTYKEHVKTNLYDKLADGTYLHKDGNTYDTDGFILWVHDYWTTTGYPNGAAWDLGMALSGVLACGVNSGPWKAAVLAEVAALDFSDDIDVLGLAGAVYGLSCAVTRLNPFDHTLKDLADKLASYQIDGGGFSWSSNQVVPGEESVAETAYAVLALNMSNRYCYMNQINGAAEWLATEQIITGGWSGDSGENNEVTGEALWALKESQTKRDPVACFIAASSDN